MDWPLGSSIDRPILTRGYGIVASVRDAAAGQRLTVRIIRLAPEMVVAGLLTIRNYPLIR